MIQKKEKKRGRGRPKLDRTERSGVTVHARITNEEKSKLDWYLKEKSISLSDLIVSAIDPKPL